MVQLNQITRKNFGKVIYSLFIMIITEALFTGFLTAPSISILSGESISLQQRFLAFFLLYITVIVWLIFQFGFAIMLLRMVRNEHVTLGYIFLGFKKIKVCFKYIFVFSLIITFAAIVTRFSVNYLFYRFIESQFEEVSAAVIQILMFLVMFFIVAFVTASHFAFVFHLHFDNPSKPVSTIFSKSFKMMRGNVLRLLAFALRAGGKNLLIVIVLALAINFIPSETRKSLSFLVFFFDLIYFVNMYTAMVRIYFTVPILYVCECNKDKAVDIVC